MDGPLGPELWRLRREDLLREAEMERLARSVPKNDRPPLRPLKLAGRLLGLFTGVRPAPEPAADPAPLVIRPGRRVPASARRCGQHTEKRAA